VATSVHALDLLVTSLVVGSPASAGPKDPYDAFPYEVVVPTPKEWSLRVKKDVSSHAGSTVR
jgi:hypothetical protein